MRIGISTLMIQRGKTGVAQYVFALLRQLQEQCQEYQFTLFVLEEDLPLFSFTNTTMERVVVSEKYRPPVKNIVWHQRHLPGLVQKHRVDVLHVPSYRRLVARGTCVRVATIHDLAPFRVARKYDWKRMLYGRVVVRWLARRQDRIIAVSNNTAKDIATFFHLPENRIHVIHNGIDHDRFSPGSPSRAKVQIARRFGVKGPFFLYVARLEHPGKNHVRLIEAFNRFRAGGGVEWQLVFGGSDWNGAEAIHAAIASSPYRKDVHPIGFVPDSELPDLYRAADILAYPSLYEGFGLPPLEAMACGCPVISSTRGSLGEVIGDAAVAVDPEDIGDLANQLSRLASDPSAQARLRIAGIAQAAKFDWRLTAAETVKVYEQAWRRSAVGFVKNPSNSPAERVAT